MKWQIDHDFCFTLHVVLKVLIAELFLLVDKCKERSGSFLNGKHTVHTMI